MGFEADSYRGPYAFRRLLEMHGDPVGQGLAWLLRGWGLGGPCPHADFPMHVSVTGGVGSMVRTGDRMHLDGI